MMTTSKPNDRILLALCLSAFLASLNFLAMAPFYSQMSDDLGVSVSVLGQSTTVMILMSAFLGIAIGPIADRYGYRKPLILGVVSVAVYLFGVGLAPSYPFVIGMSLFGALGDALTFGVPLAIAGVLYHGQERKRTISLIIGAASVGAVIGVPLLTLIGSVSSWRVAFISSSAGALGIALFVSRSIPAEQRAEPGPWSFALFRGAYTPILDHPPTLRLLGSSVGRSACWTGLLTYLGAYLSDQLDLSTRQIGLVYLVGGAGFAVASVFAQRLLSLAPDRWLVAAMCLVSASATIALVVTEAASFAVGLILVLAVSSAIASIGVLSLLSEQSPAEPGATMLLNGSLLSLGGATGAAVGGIALAIGGYPALGVGLSGFALIGAGLLLWGREPSRSRVATAGHADVASGMPAFAELQVTDPTAGPTRVADEFLR